MRVAARGFSLLEMLVALAIVAVGLTAALRASGVGVDALGEYRSHAHALWLAQNIVAERVARGDWPTPGTTTTEEEFAKHRFIVRQEIQTTNPRFRRLDVKVSGREEPGRTLQHSVAFLTPPQ